MTGVQTCALPIWGESSSLQGEECPICTEPYDVECGRRMVLLNCDHTLCRGCLTSILKRAVDPSRVQCPLCRQKTPILHWEIQRMQEEIVYCSGVYGPGQMEEDSLTEPESTPRLCPGLEERLLSRVGPVRLCGCCLRPRRADRGPESSGFCQLKNTEMADRPDRKSTRLNSSH